MSATRSLVDCVVLSLQDACVFYPCCKGCFSRIDVEQEDTTRCRCSKCGYSCMRELVDYRYRLSLRVSRDRCIFGVTVFGTCLNPFFGIHASGLQRLVENSDGPVGVSTRSMLLQKAVKECFIGRHFIFGIKVTETESGPWLGANGSSSKDTVHFIASQMILPKATGLEGCTVVSYYRIILQKAAEYEIDPSKTSKLPATTLLLIPRHSPAGSFNSDTLCSSGLLSQSMLRSHYQDCTLTPTPPWQQSLGLVTSSAEQEEDCSTQDSGDENNSQSDNSKTPHHAQRDCSEDHKVTEETVLSPLLSLECSSYNRTSFANYPHLSIEKAGGNTPILKTWLSPSPLGHSCKAKGFQASRQLTETFLKSSVAWEDLPFSENLSEFLHEENKDVDIMSKTEPRRNVPSQNEATRNNLEVKSQDKNLSIHITDCHSRILLDITNTPAVYGGDRHDLSEQVRKSPAGSINKSQARNICSHECKQEDEKDSSLSFENEEEQLEGDTYNCSADLFSSSLMIDVVTNKLNTCAETVRMTTEACPVLCKPDKRHLRGEKTNVPHSTPDKQKLKSEKCSLIPPGIQELDFIPPSQSTPIVKAAVVSGSPASSYRTLTLDEFSQDSSAFYRNMPEPDSKRPVKVTSSLKLNCVRADQLCQHARDSTKENQVRSETSSRHSQRFTPKRRFWKPDKNKNHVLAQQHPRVMKGALNTGSTGRFKCDSSDRDATACDYEDSKEVIVPPTPAAKTRQSVKLRRRMQTDNRSSNLGLPQEGQQGAGVNYKRSLLDQTLTSSHQCDSETVDEGNLDASNCYRLDNENEACDWSRDLFSDSV